MNVCLGEIHNRPVTLELKDGIVYLDGEAQPIKNLTETELTEYQKELDELPASSDPGYAALVNAVRAAFIARLLSKAVGDECIDKLTHVLEHVHYDVLKYLEETDDGSSEPR